MATMLFYQVAESTPAAIDAVLPPLLQKINSSGQPLLLIAPTAERAQRLDEALWGFAPESFLPHTLAGGARDDAQPILISHLEEAALPTLPPARLPVLVAGAEAALTPFIAGGPEKLCYLFSTAPTDVSRARGLYKQHKEAGHTVRYFAQEGARWVEK